MIWSKDSLQGLSEKDLCLKVLIPLFKAMGYQDVRYYHGGVLEQGKDIVMWKQDELRGRVNYAAVVKAEKITGSASIIGVVGIQAQQALGSTFLDEHTHEAHPVHEVLIVTSKEITKEGDEALRNSLAGAHVYQRITKINGDRLWDLVQKYLPHETMFSSLAEAYKALSDIDSEYGYIVELAPNRVQLTAFPKGEDPGPIPVSFEPSFPDTPEGKEQEEAFRRHVASGKPAQISAEYLKIKGLPEPVGSMLQRAPEGTFFLGPRKSLKTLTASLIFRKLNGEEEVLFPLIEFGTNYVGEEEVTFGNDQQPIPFKFHLTINTATRRVVLRYGFTEAEKNAHSLLRSVEFQAALAQGGTLMFEEYETGHRFAHSDMTPGATDHPGEGFLDLLRKLSWIQRQLGTEITLPQRELFDDNDMEEILSVEAILRTGTFLGECSEATLVLKSTAALQNLLNKHPDGILGEMRVVQDYRHTLLGSEIPLGPVELVSSRVQIDPMQIESLRNLGPDTDSPSVSFIPEEGAFEAKFRNWPKSSSAVQAAPAIDSTPPQEGDES